MLKEDLMTMHDDELWQKYNATVQQLKTKVRLPKSLRKTLVILWVMLTFGSGEMTTRERRNSSK